MAWASEFKALETVEELLEAFDELAEPVWLAVRLCRNCAKPCPACVLVIEDIQDSCCCPARMIAIHPPQFYIGCGFPRASAEN
jgi:hypothetical protein